jgi:hypothetical protein
MRAVSLLPLACAAAVVTACGGSDVSSVPHREETAARPAVPRERDLKRQMVELPVEEVASAVELERPRAAPRTTPIHRARPKPQPAPRPTGEPAVPPVVPARPAVTAPPADSAPVEAAASGGRELAPGRTVIVIPVSSGPTLKADEEDFWLPGRAKSSGRHRCRRRAGVRGIAVTGRIPVSISRLHLR